MAATAERSAVEVLRAARERISDPERWTTDTFARSANGLRVEPNAEAACEWCAAGALFCEVGVSSDADRPDLPTSRIPGFDHLVDAAMAVGHEISTINDHHGHNAVLALFDRAIELAEAAA